jgi:hypothetical protein
MTTPAQYAASTVRKTGDTVQGTVGATPFTSNLQLGAVVTGSVATDGSSLLVVATDAAAERVAGVFTQINYMGLTTGDQIELNTGIYGFANSTLHPVLGSGVRALCYVEGTTGYVVAASGTCNSNVAGRVISLDAVNNIVYVDVGRPNTTI